MQAYILQSVLVMLGAPLLGALVSGIGCHYLGRRTAHVVTISLMTVSFLAALFLFKLAVFQHETLDTVLYTWAESGRFNFSVGFLIDSLSAVMITVVTFVSLLVHIYSVGYMHDDASNPRFFSYVSLFTFSMLLLVTANNFFLLFLGWEGVGLVSYLLIGFWFHKESAAAGSLKAFLVNRVGDFGFILGIAAILINFGSLDYQTVFSAAPNLLQETMSIFPHTHWSLLTVICVLLFIGAMGKSAQVPLHIWLPESMEGPTPISALIHAATMVTAGVYLVARMSPLFEFSEVAQSLVLVVGATGALFLGLLAFVEYDIKRIIAYSTMSQLGYMMAANGASAFSAGIFHLLTHACFKALLFLCAGSVIIAMHHEQDLRKMGNLIKYLPWTAMTFLIGACALSAIPPFSGYFSKDIIIESVHASTIWGAHYAYICLLIGAFVTSYYIFRAYFMAFHTTERFDESMRAQLKETPWSMRLPLVLLAIPSLVLGVIAINPMIFHSPRLLEDSLTVATQYDVLATLQASYHGVIPMIEHAVLTLPFWFSMTGIFTAWLFVVACPGLPNIFQKKFSWIHIVLKRQFGFDAFNDWFFVRGARVLSQFFYHVTDLRWIDHYMVGGTARQAMRISRLLRWLQTGYLYHYVFVMIVALLLFLLWLLLG